MVDLIITHIFNSQALFVSIPGDIHFDLVLLAHFHPVECPRKPNAQGRGTPWAGFYSIVGCTHIHASHAGGNLETLKLQKWPEACLIAHTLKHRIICLRVNLDMPINAATEFGLRGKNHMEIVYKCHTRTEPEARFVAAVLHTELP